MKAGAVAMAALIAGVLACGGAGADAPRPGGPALHGDAPMQGLGGPLDLTADDGAPFTVQRLHGRPALLFFGYTHCGTSCPVALVVAKEVAASFPVMSAPSVLFVTLDPLSDDAGHLREYLAHFDRRFVGLTGSPEQVDRVARRYGVGRETRDGTLAHSARWYLLDGEGRLVRTYALSTPAEELRDDARRLAGGLR
jgi:protein SCO1/2